MNAAHAVLDATVRTGVDPRRFAWAAVGEATATVLAAAGVTHVFVPSRPDGVTLAAELPLSRRASGSSSPRTDIADETLPDALRARGADVVQVVAYTTVEAPADVPGPPRRGARRWARRRDPRDQRVDGARPPRAWQPTTRHGRDSSATPVVAIGEPSAAVARDLGFRRVLVAPSPEPAALAAFIARSLGVVPAAASPDLDAVPTGGAR